MMLDGFSWSLLLSAAGIALTHTLLGPDHYLPFLMLARANHWSRSRALLVTGVCGVGHVASSVLLGGLGLALGVAVARLQLAEGARGDLAAWALVAFGTGYALWGVRRALRRARGMEPHHHTGHVHLHRDGVGEHRHEEGEEGIDKSFWVLFTIFVLGPCEPLIPLFMLPASRGRWSLALVTAALFGVLTVACMLAVTLAGLFGLSRLPATTMRRWERWSHATAGAVIAGSGLAIVALGL